MDGTDEQRVQNGLNRLDVMSFEELLLFETLFEAYDKKVQKALRNPAPGMYVYSEQRLPHPYIDATLKRIDDHKRTFLIMRDPRAKRYYENVVHTDATEIVNGYPLIGFKWTHPYLSFDYYNRLLTKVTTKENMSDEVFVKWLEHNCCTDWNKKNIDGITYTGPYWGAEEGTEERDNAYQLTGIMNRNALLALPFHRSLIKASIRCGCNTRLESVKYSNSFCVWFERTREVVEQ